MEANSQLRNGVGFASLISPVEDISRKGVKQIRRLIATLGLVILLGVFPVSLEAQTAYGRILGTVTDASGAVVPNADVTATNLGTNVPSAVKSSTEGYSDVANLIPGKYQVTVEVAGFKKFVASDLVLLVDQKLWVDATLQPGAVTSTMEVVARGQMINTDSSTIGKVVENKEIIDLPLVSRNFVQLASLSAGTVVDNGGTLASEQNSFRSTLSGGSIWVGGGRRSFLQSMLVVASSAAVSVSAETAGNWLKPAELTYWNEARGIRIFPGEWRPHYPWEQIAWISPAWPCQDYMWLDFPEVIFSNVGLLFSSHDHPSFPTAFHNLTASRWSSIPGGIAFDRELPNGVRFGGSVTLATETSVDLELHLWNGSSRRLTGLDLQTCCYLRAVAELADPTTDNMYVHAPEGWITLTEALRRKEGRGKYLIGWRSGPPLADQPVIVTKSNQADEYVAMTWYENTLSLISNSRFPCMHADPHFKDLDPGESTSIHGKLIFFNGKLGDFDYRKI